MTDNILPEEKLLKLIRAGKKQDVLINNKSPALTPSAITDLKNISKPFVFLGLQKYLSVFSIRKIIWVFFAVSCIYFVSSFIYPWFGLKQIKLSEVPDSHPALPEVAGKPTAKPYEFYLEGIQGRQIFTSTSTEIQEGQHPVSGANVDLIKDISLVGIISGDNPQAVIEDKNIQKTYYVTKGQFIGQFEVKDIQEGKIILHYNNQRYELYL